MDAVEKAGRIASGTRTLLLTNELALVAPPGSSTTVAQVMNGAIRRLAMAEPAAVPAGVYGRRFLEHENVWARLSPKVVPFPTVRAVLAAVEAGRVDAGIVYRTDAMIARVRVLANVAAKDHPYLDIAYPAAVIAGPSEAEGMRFLEYLKGPAARAVFDKRGFGRPSP
jgi:molybdate transport system substrate-binding protein